MAGITGIYHSLSLGNRKIKKNCLTSTQTTLQTSSHIREVKVKETKMKWPLIADRSRQQQTRQSETSRSPMEGRIVKQLNHPRDNTSAASIPLTMTQASPRSPLAQNDKSSPRPPIPTHRFILLFSGIILGKVFDVFGDLHVVFENENVFAFKCELECEFKNVNCDFDFNHDCDLFNGYNDSIPYPSSYPTSTAHAKPFNSRAGLREQVALEGVFGVNVNENGFVCIVIHGCNNNFYNDGYYYHPPYLITTPGPTPTTITIFNVINAEICKIIILQCIFGIGLCENDIDNVICSSMFVFL